MQLTEETFEYIKDRYQIDDETAVKLSLLISTGMSIKEACNELGFSSYTAYYNRINKYPQMRELINDMQFDTFNDLRGKAIKALSDLLECENEAERGRNSRWIIDKLPFEQAVKEDKNDPLVDVMRGIQNELKQKAETSAD